MWDDGVECSDHIRQDSELDVAIESLNSASKLVVGMEVVEKGLASMKSASSFLKSEALACTNFLALLQTVPAEGAPQATQEVLARAEELRGRLRKMATECCSKLLSTITQELEKVSGGVKDGKSWKQDVDRKAQWKVVKKKAESLVATDGFVVTDVHPAFKRASQSMQQASEMQERFGVGSSETLAEMKKAASKQLALAATTLAEATLVSIVTDDSLSSDAKQQKIQTQYGKITGWSRDFSRDILGDIHPAIISLSVGKLVKRPS